jgi:hypothetical protein
MGELATVPKPSAAGCPTPRPHATPPPTPGVIDHTAYPQIMDVVFASAPRAALLSLRATSRTYRARVDALLSRHLALTDADLRSALGPRVPPSTPEVLDCFAHFALQPAPHVFDAAGAPILRMRDGPLAVIDCVAPATVVVFGWHRRNEPPEAKWVLLGGSRRASPVEHCTTVRKVVIVIDGVPDYTCYAKGMVRAWPSIADITVVYAPQAPASGGVSLDTKIGNILYEMVPRVRWGGGLRLTFVNAAAMPAGAFPAAGRVSWWATDLLGENQEACKAEDVCLRHMVERATLQEYVEAVRAKFPLAEGAIRFLSLEEYERELGPEAFALETDPDFVLR